MGTRRLTTLHDGPERSPLTARAALLTWAVLVLVTIAFWWVVLTQLIA